MDEQWTDWFAGLAVFLKKNGDTLLTGLIKKICDLGLPLQPGELVTKL